MFDGNNHPSDIDMFYIGRDNTLIIGEIKNERGKLGYGQRRLMEKIVNNWKHEAMCLFIVHNKYVQNGDDMVDVPECYVLEYYYKGNAEWHCPHQPTQVKEILKRYL